MRRSRPTSVSSGHVPRAEQNPNMRLIPVYHERRKRNLTTRTGIMNAIDFQRDGGVEPGRLERCLGLTAVRVGPGRYRVTGGDEPHWVDLRSRFVPRCDCGDHLWRERVCKHILAALLREGDPRVIAEVGGLVRTLRTTAQPSPTRHR
jgi:hypothetical protein